ncbi:hypothetical protein QO002_006268 [Pararhizobium capsulatum DSM 1112]|uniref:Uncharacterized protein n=1 Tax=Pararhizobium capsulatum DSM 1112 TaxID=1121113 RepID=A0ABU0C0K1_9HYPH|nr:hypothetical protein [Pararhizobium capsulatum]MDQ0324061.1 hypothetical protein [Pararhizobium capsulatum DSM 1112]
MAFPDRPLASISKEKLGDGWLVKTLNVGDQVEQEYFFKSEAAADAYLSKQYELVRTENGG